MLEKLKGIGIGIGTIIALEVIRGFMYERLKDVTPEDVYDAIKNNTNLLKVTPENIKKAGISLRKRFGGILMGYADLFTPELVLEEWFKIDYPNLYSIIVNTPGGINWFNQQVNMIKKEIIFGDRYE